MRQRRNGSAPSPEASRRPHDPVGVPALPAKAGTPADLIQFQQEPSERNETNAEGGQHAAGLKNDHEIRRGGREELLYAISAQA